MGAPRPWPTHWPEPGQDNPFFEPDDGPGEGAPKPDYVIEEDPLEDPHTLPEERLVFDAVTWGVTGRCNLRCMHCYDAVTCARRDMDTAAALAVIERLMAVGVRYVVFSGGEPLLRPDLPVLLRACQDRLVGTALRSNGTLITPEKARLLADCGVQVAGISLDGATAEVHEVVRGPGSFARTLAGAAALRDAGLRVMLEVVLSRRNAHQALDFVALGERLGVAEINFAALAPVGRAADRPEDCLDPVLWMRLCRDLYAASQTAAVAVSPACSLVGTCVAGQQLHITCDGWVQPCYLSSERLFHIFDAWRSPARRDVCGRALWLRCSQMKV